MVLNIYLGVIAAAIIVLINVAIFCQRRRIRFFWYALDHFSKLYFCGHNLANIYLNEFFPRFGEYIGFGFCWSSAAWAMLAFRDNPTSRLVHASALDKNGEYTGHAWMEVYYSGIWWIIDPCWCSLFFNERHRMYRRKDEIKSVRICEHDEFWQYQISRELEERAQKPETSYLFYEVERAYMPYKNSSAMFHPHIADLRLGVNGESLHPGTYLDDQGGRLIFSQRILNEFMTKPTRRRPKAHTIHKALAIKKLYRQHYVQQTANT